MTKPAKNTNVLAENPLDAILGFGNALGGRKSKAVESVRQTEQRRPELLRSEDDSASPSKRAAQTERAEAVGVSADVRPEINAPEPEALIAPAPARVNVVADNRQLDDERRRAAAVHSVVEVSPAVSTATGTAVTEPRPTHQDLSGSPSRTLASTAPPSLSQGLEQGRAPAANSHAASAAQSAAVVAAPLGAPPSPELPSAISIRKSVVAETAVKRTPLPAAMSSTNGPAGELTFEESATEAPQAVRADEVTGGNEDDDLAGRGASFRHRIGTIQEPYIRADGTKVRQWSITLPHDLIRRVSHYAVDRGVKPAVLAKEALEQLLEKAGR